MATKKKASVKVIRYQVPQYGIVGYKRAFSKDKNSRRLVTLWIPADAHVIMGDSDKNERKCRASKAKVLEITCLHGIKQHEKAFTKHNQHTGLVYEVGKVMKPQNGFDRNTRESCRAGIHFFLSKEDAENYSY